MSAVMGAAAQRLRVTATKLDARTAIHAIPIVLLLSACCWRYRPRSLRLHSSTIPDPYDAQSTDPGLLKKHSTIESYSTSFGTYPRIRTFFKPHPNENKLPADLPLLVFIHGLGGSVAQFSPLLTSLSACGPCLAIDFPGCGLSDFVFETHEGNALGTAALAALVVAAIENHRQHSQKVVLIGHSMGGAIAGLISSGLATANPSLVHDDNIGGCIAICPAILPEDEKQFKAMRMLRWMPALAFDWFRAMDKRGGINSASIARFVGKDADPETKRLQLRFNEQSKSKVFLSMVAAMAPSSTQERLPTAEEIWSNVRVPLFLIAGGADHLCPPEVVKKISDWLIRHRQDSAATPSAAPTPAAAGDLQGAVDAIVPEPVTSQEQHFLRSDSAVDENHTTSHGRALKMEVLPAPASHGLLYAGSSVRILSGLIQGFLSKHIDKRLSLGWQLQHLTTSGKWDVKNLAKWQKIDPCSKPIAGIFRAMKTMREVDEHHNPKEFVRKFGWDAMERQDGVCAVVDISHESPVYNPKNLEDAEVEYHKFPTVSKLPPTLDEVAAFIALIDRLRSPDPGTATLSDPTASSAASPDPKAHFSSATLHKKIEAGATIAVHCHYGFNRTGFFLICYLVEKLGWELQTAIREFEVKRSPGIKHDYFVNELFVRYGVGAEARLQRRGTLVG